MKNRLLQITKWLTNTELLLAVMLALNLLVTILSVITNSSSLFVLGCGVLSGLWILAIAIKTLQFIRKQVGKEPKNPITYIKNNLPQEPLDDYTKENK